MTLQMDLGAISENEYASLFDMIKFPSYNTTITISDGITMTSKSPDSPMLFSQDIYRVIINFADDLAHDVVIAILSNYIYERLKEGPIMLNGLSLIEISINNIKAAISSLFDERNKHD